MQPNFINNPKFSHLKHIVAILIAIGVIYFAFSILHHYLKDVTWHSVLNTMQATPLWKIAVGLGATLVSFSALATYDVLAARKIGRGRVPMRIAIMGGLIGNAISNTVGLHIVTGSFLRYRIYSTTGIKLDDISRIVVLAWFGLWSGYITIATLALLFKPASLSILHIFSFNADHIAGTIIAIVVTLILVWLSKKPRRILYKKWHIPLPSWQVAMEQMAIGTIEMLAAMVVLYVFLPAGLAPNFMLFALFYLSAVLLGVMSHSPGGIGVFEATMMATLSARGSADLVAALLLYRIIYNITPFCLAIIAFIIFEIRRKPVAIEPEQKNT